MLSSIVLTSALAVAVLATPLQHLDKRAYVYATAPAVTEYVTVATVTVYDLPATPAVQSVDYQTQAKGENGGKSRGGRPRYSSQAPASSQAPPAADPKPSQAADKDTQSSQTANQPASPPASDDYQANVKYHHNVHRANHSADDLEWSQTLADTAKKIADTCVYAHSMDVDGGGYGQNIAAGITWQNVGVAISNLFYNKEEPLYASLYDQASPSMDNFHEWGHFTQIVWKGTTSVGCATVDCTARGLANVGSDTPKHFTVCNYGAPGNYAGQYADNVMRPLGQPSVSAPS